MSVAERLRGDGRDELHGDAHVVLLVDDAGRLRREHPDAEDRLVALATAGRRARLHVVVTAARWTELRPALLDAVGTRLELRLDDAVDSRFPRGVAAALPYGPGAALSPEGAPVRLALADGTEPVRAPAGRRAPRVRPLPAAVHEDEIVPSDPHAAQFTLGVLARRSRPALLPLLEPGAHLLVVGDRGSGRSTLLRRVVRWYASGVDSGTEVSVHMLDPRRTSAELADLPGVAAYAGSAATAAQVLAAAAAHLRDAADPASRRHVVVVDDAELLAGGDLLLPGTPSPLEGLATLVGSATDHGLHVVLARRVGGLARAAYDPLLARLREHADAVLVLSGDRSEGPVARGVSATPMPAGRGRLLRAHGGEPDGELVQCALPREADP